jgi:hypothetical protein
MRWFTASPVFATLLVTLGLASSAQAAPAMFSASFIMDAFGNDITTGTAFPSNATYFVPMPLGTTGCAPYYPGSSGYHPCLAASQRGKSATGTGSISVVTTGIGPAPIALPQSALGVTTVGFWPISIPNTYYTTYASFVNEAGSFFAGGGPAAGHGTITHKGKGQRIGSWFIHEGENGLGGAMGLLGKQGAYARFEIKEVTSLPGPFVGTSSWNMIRALGRSGMDSLNPYTNIGTFTNTYLGTKTTYTKLASGTPWTTGSVTVYATSGTFTTILHRKGFDTTTASGVRNIQLVTPSLTHWKRGHGRPSNHTGHIGILKLHIVPEPQAVLLIGAGAGVLVVLRRVSRRG